MQSNGGSSAEPDIPTYIDLMYPTLEALAALGGRGQRDQLVGKVLDLAAVTPEQLAVEFPPGRTQRGSKVFLLAGPA